MRELAKRRSDTMARLGKAEMTLGSAGLTAHATQHAEKQAFERTRGKAETTLGSAGLTARATRAGDHSVVSAIAGSGFAWN
jgi:hypothetical protein